MKGKSRNVITASELERLLRFRPHRARALEGELASQERYLGRPNSLNKLLQRERAIAAFEIALKSVREAEGENPLVGPETALSSFDIVQLIQDVETLYRVSVEDAADWTKADGNRGGSNSDYRITMQAYLAGLAEFMNVKLDRRRKGYALVSDALSGGLNQGAADFFICPAVLKLFGRGQKCRKAQHDPKCAIGSNTANRGVGLITVWTLQFARLPTSDNAQRLIL